MNPRWLVKHEAENYRLKDAAHRLIVTGNYSCRDRPASILLEWAGVRAT